MSKQEQALETRQRLLTAAITTMQEHGIAALTLDAVAKEARISKGGLLHHFASKTALIEAILRHLFADFESRVQAYYDAEPDQPGRWLRAYVRATYHAASTGSRVDADECHEREPHAADTNSIRFRAMAAATGC
jgi:AcrR family transcriptional regulator